jgi:hypothetical protein
MRLNFTMNGPDKIREAIAALGEVLTERGIAATTERQYHAG